MNYNNIQELIREDIKENNRHEISGPITQNVLLQMVQLLGLGYQFVGIATPQTNPPEESDAKLLYICGEGNYGNFGNNYKVPKKSIGFLTYDSDWHLETISIIGEISEEDIEDNAVTENKIKNGSITEDKLGNNVVTTNKLVDKSVTEDKLGDGAVTEDKIDKDAVTENKIKNGSVSEDKIATGSVTENKLGDNSVTNNKLSTQLQEFLTALNTVGYKFALIANINDESFTPTYSMFKIANTIGTYPAYDNISVSQADGICAFIYDKSANNPSWSKLPLGIAFPSEIELIVETFTGNTLQAQVGKYYIASAAVETLAITLPAISDLTRTKSIMMNLVGGTTPNITFISADNKPISYYAYFEIESGLEYELNIMFNGSKWIVAYGIIESNI